MRAVSSRRPSRVSTLFLRDEAEESAHGKGGVQVLGAFAAGEFGRGAADGAATRDPTRCLT